MCSALIEGTIAIMHVEGTIPEGGLGEKLQRFLTSKKKPTPHCDFRIFVILSFEGVIIASSNDSK